MGASYGLFDNDVDMALNLGFSGFRRGYDFYKTDWKYLNDRLKSMTRDKLVELDVVLKFWEVYDIIMVNNRGDVSKWKNLFSKLESIK